MSPCITFTVSPNVRSVISEDGGVLMDVVSGALFTVNIVGGFVWSQLALGKSLEDITIALSRECNVPNQQVLSDVKCFFKDLQDKRLIL